MNQLIRPSRSVIPDMDSVKQLVDSACLRLAPAFELRDLIAVNPFLGFTDRPFGQCVAEIESMFHADVLPSAAELWQSYQAGDYGLDDIVWGLSEVGQDKLAETPVAAASRLERYAAQPSAVPGPRTCTVLDQLFEAYPREMLEAPMLSLTRMLAAREDQGIARAQADLRRFPLLKSYGFYAQRDKTVDLAGLPGFCGLAAGLEDDPYLLIERVLRDSQLDEEEDVELYLARLLARLPGYGGLYRAQAFARGPQERGELPELLAILAFQDWAVRKLLAPGVTPRCTRADAGFNQERALRYAALRAREQAYARSLMNQMTPPSAEPEEACEQPNVQALFCIDVRSERVRAGLEQESGSHTYGFAGFFGIPLAVGTSHGARPHCPPLLQPSLHFDSREFLAKTGAIASAQGRLKKSGLSALSFVEGWGFRSMLELVKDGLSGQESPAQRAGESLPLEIDAIDFATRLALGRSILENSALEVPYARLVVFFGHGSHVANNPQAASLACGACAGHSGAISARVAAHVLSDPTVRAALVDEGFELSDDVVFLAGLHDTMTDELRILDQDRLPASHRADLAALEESLLRAGQWARAHRGPAPEFAPADTSLQALRRSARDPAEVQPEWGLAGNAAFVIGRRELTRNTPLSGRCFLHSYDARRDADGAVLRMILTAPAIVGAWISYQYYASTLAPEVFASGRKTLHNIVGSIGVTEGGQGDLRVGLSEESLSQNGKNIHEPIRLQLVVEVEQERVETILDEEPSIGSLIKGGWMGLHLIHPRSGARSTFHPGRGFVQQNLV